MEDNIGINHQILQTIIQEYNSRSNKTFNKDKLVILNFFKSIISSNFIVIITKTLESCNNIDIQEYDQVLNYLQSLQINHKQLGSCIETLCNKLTEFNINIGITLTKENLYIGFLKGILTYFQEQLNAMKTEERNILLLEYKINESEARQIGSEINQCDEGICEYIIRKEYNKRNNKYFIVTKKVTKVTKMMSKRVLERKSWKSFNLEKADPTLRMQNTPLELVYKQENNDQTIKNEDLSGITKNSKLICRNCGEINSHITVKCPKERSEKMTTSMNNLNTITENTNERRTYVAPHSRDNNRESTFGRRERHAVRVRNIPTYVTEDDVADMFSCIGRVYRVTIPKDKQTGGNTDYCYINLDSAEAVERAVKKFNGGKFDSSIITVEAQSN